ncbi:hypothetical protein E4U59_007444, partial [Claviceps monticola]
MLGDVCGQGGVSHQLLNGRTCVRVKVHKQYGRGHLAQIAGSSTVFPGKVNDGTNCSVHKPLDCPEILHQHNLGSNAQAQLLLKIAGISYRR